MMMFKGRVGIRTKEVMISPSTPPIISEEATFIIDIDCKIKLTIEGITINGQMKNIIVPKLGPVMRERCLLIGISNKTVKAWVINKEIPEANIALDKVSSLFHFFAKELPIIRPQTISRRIIAGVRTLL